MTVEKLTADRAIELLREVVAEAGGDFVYKNEEGYRNICWYWHSGAGKPGCVVGRVLHRHGWSQADLVKIEGLAIEVAENTHEELGDSLGFIHGNVTEDAQRVLRVAQMAQDDGSPWGEALAKAELAYRGIAKEPANA